ncbi:MAG: hypothetical protein KJZ87_04000 [Thermoguttaceae bacterium]|nr:hypothetical protein [Thermoguttaceae bacterium]
MSEVFDPYYIWLGIPPEEQPPHYYRLLGLRAFETNADAIGHAADQRMTLLRTFQTGKHTDESQRLLNEVALARVTLLNPDKKAAYDQQLQTWLASVATPPPLHPRAAAPPDNVPSAWPLEVERPTRRQRSHRRSSLLLAAVALAVLATVGAIFWAGGWPVAELDGPSSGVEQTNSPPVSGTGVPPGTHRSKSSPNTPGQMPAAPAVPASSVAVSPADRLDATVDLLALVDPQTHAVRGSWRKEDGALAAGMGTNLLQIPFAPPEEYDLSLTAEHVGGQSGIYLGTVAGGRHFQVLIDGYLTSGGVAGIELLDGQIALRNAAQRQGLFLPRGQPFTLTYRIRKNGLTVERDGGSIFAWQGDFARCSTRAIWSVPDPRRLALALANAEYRFTAITISPPAEPIDFGRISLAPPLVEPPSGAPPTEGGSQPLPTVAAESPPQDTPDETTAPRLPLPEVARQDEIASHIRQVVNVDAARTAEEKQAALAELVRLADQARDRPDERFVLWREAIKLAVAAGNAQRAIEATDRIAADFQIDAVMARLSVLKDLTGTARDESQIAALVTAADTVIDDALDSGQYAAALEAATAAYRASQRPAGQGLRKQVHERQKAVEKIHSHWQNVQKSLELLAADPADPAANLEAGKWHAFTLNDWERGLPCLSKGSDAALAAAAQQELDARPADGEAEAVLGDLWWDLARQYQGDDREAILAHAGTWYEKAAASLPSGLLQTKVNKRLDDLAGTEKPGRSSGGGNVLRGRWLDLFRWVDVQRDSVQGRWLPTPAGLAVASGPFNRLMLPVEIQGDYDLEIAFTRTAGDDTIGLILPVASTSCLTFVSGWSGRFRGIEFINGREGDNNEATRRPGTVVDRQRYTLLVSVRTDGTSARIDGRVNGQPSISWSGPVASLRTPGGWSLPQGNRPALGANQSTMVFHSARLRLITGNAKLLRKDAAAGRTP